MFNWHKDRDYVVKIQSMIIRVCGLLKKHREEQIRLGNQLWELYSEQQEIISSLAKISTIESEKRTSEQQKILDKLETEGKDITARIQKTASDIAKDVKAECAVHIILSRELTDVKKKVNEIKANNSDPDVIILVNAILENIELYDQIQEHSNTRTSAILDYSRTATTEQYEAYLLKQAEEDAIYAHAQQISNQHVQLILEILEKQPFYKRIIQDMKQDKKYALQVGATGIGTTIAIIGAALKIEGSYTNDRIGTIMMLSGILINTIAAWTSENPAPNNQTNEQRIAQIARTLQNRNPNYKWKIYQNQ